MDEVKIHKLVKKEHLGYSCTTVDHVIFETDNKRGLLIVDDVCGQRISIDLTTHTIETLSELLRYLKSDLEGGSNA